MDTVYLGWAEPLRVGRLKGRWEDNVGVCGVHDCRGVGSGRHGCHVGMQPEDHDDGDASRSGLQSWGVQDSTVGE